MNIKDRVIGSGDVAFATAVAFGTLALMAFLILAKL